MILTKLLACKVFYPLRRCHSGFGVFLAWSGSGLFLWKDSPPMNLKEIRYSLTFWSQCELNFTSLSLSLSSLKNSRLDVCPWGDSLVWCCCSKWCHVGFCHQMGATVKCLEFHVPLVLLLYQCCIRVLYLIDIIFLQNHFWVNHHTVLMEMLGLVEWCAGSAEEANALLGGEITSSWIKKTHICFSKIILSHSKLKSALLFTGNMHLDFTA